MSVELKTTIKCHGRDGKGRKVLEQPVQARLNVGVITATTTHVESLVSLDVDCDYVAGGHRDFCQASGKEEKVPCVFAIDLPYAKDNR